MRYLDLNNPQFLYNHNYSYFCRSLLSNKDFNIEPIGETSIDQWLVDVKAKLSDFVGSDEGLFYDVLVANAFTKQVISEKNPLTSRQIESIKTYYKEGEISQAILLLTMPSK